jgi:hypothetical protein
MRFTFADVLNHKAGRHKRTFEGWMDKVGLILRKTVGLSYSDLADQPYRDWYDSGMTPSQAARQTLQNEGFPNG